jgi:hypothetical protein
MLMSIPPCHSTRNIRHIRSVRAAARGTSYKPEEAAAARGSSRSYEYSLSTVDSLL